VSSESAGFWQRLYQTKSATDVSWYEPVPQASLDLIRATGLPLSAPIIDVGGGDSRLVDHLLDAGYSDVTVLDIAPAALERARARLGTEAARVDWITADVTTFRPQRRYALWHDRAAFHFLVTPSRREQYLSVLRAALVPKGHLILATFGPQGPTRCSGLPVQRYSEEDLAFLLGPGFQVRRHRLENHHTPTGREQQFLWSWWQATALTRNLAGSSPFT
jgi:SAM-dependent methyltransferase